MLGHLWKNGPDTALRCVGFQTMLIRGTEWAATGKASYPVLDDFPTESQIKPRPASASATSSPPSAPSGTTAGSVAGR